MHEYDVAVAYGIDGIKAELNLRVPGGWRLVYAYQAAPIGLFGLAEGGHILIFGREGDQEKSEPKNDSDASSWLRQLNKWEAKDSIQPPAALNLSREHVKTRRE